MSEDALLTAGSLGLFGIALLDSALLPLAGGPDGVLIALAAWAPLRAPLYVGAATAGSALGCLVLYYLARRAGPSILRRIPESRRERLQHLLGRYDLLAVAMAVFLPPPFPTKPAILMAGVMGLPRHRFLTGVLLGRIMRYGLEGYLAARIGSDAMAWIARTSPTILLGAALLVLLLVLGARWRRARPNAPEI